MAAEVNLGKIGDLGAIKAIDFVNRFGTSINDLLTFLGVTRKLPLTTDMKVQLYKWETTLDTTNVGEGETIPLSTVKRVPDRDFEVSWLKKRRAVSAEAVTRYGADLAISQADQKLLREIQGGVKKSVLDHLAETTNKKDATDLQTALTLAWGELKSVAEFEDAEFVSFVNPMDVAKWLAGKPVQADASNAYGMQLLQNFIGADKVISLGSVPQGKVYTTATDNIVLAYLDLARTDLSAYFVDTMDETGLLAAVQDKTVSNLTLETVFMGAFELFAEIPDGVIETTLNAGTTDTTNDQSL
ncbi:phage capsid protein [Weissella cibaria]|nr:phage capsid protein [Weissella cibaria]